MPSWAIRLEQWCKVQHLRGNAVVLLWGLQSPLQICSHRREHGRRLQGAVARPLGRRWLRRGVGGSWVGRTYEFSKQPDKEILFRVWGWERAGKGMKLCVLLVRGIRSIFAFFPLTGLWKWSGKVCI